MPRTMKARPTTYKGIQMRSRLEAGFAQWLDSMEYDGWEYEPCAFAADAGQYLPDFRIPRLLVPWSDVLVGPAYIEVKPFVPPLGEQDALARRMAVIWQSEPDAHLLLCAPYEHSCPVGVLWTNPDRTRNDPGEPWFLGHEWLMTPRHATPAVGVHMYKQHGPWPDGYWNVG